MSAIIGVDRLSFYVLFSQYRACDIHKRISLLRFHIKVICSRIGRNVKKKGPMAKITWSEMEKQLIEACKLKRSICSIMVFGALIMGV